MSSLELVPVTIRRAKAYVRDNHRHHGPPQGARFAVGCACGGELVGVAIVGNPVARLNDDGVTAEVTRVCTDGAPNACSMLYGAARRACRALGYRRIITYTLETEPGTSLRAAGWTRVGVVRPQEWSRPSRRRPNEAPVVAKVRWEA